MAAVGHEIDHRFGRLGLMRLKAFRTRVGPAREIDHDAQVAVVSGLDGLDDVEAAAVEEVRVIAEQTFELRIIGCSAGMASAFSSAAFNVCRVCWICVEFIFIAHILWLEVT